uniref:EB domain-containing protein n=1 Tax=Caenorhabditis tropicalis TaxID=1561998 RepID=A0A1I7UFJ7_9PELO
MKFLLVSSPPSLFQHSSRSLFQVLLFLTISTVVTVSSEACTSGPCILSLPKCSPTIPCQSPNEVCDHGRCFSSDDTLLESSHALSLDGGKCRGIRCGPFGICILGVCIFGYT